MLIIKNNRLNIDKIVPTQGEVKLDGAHTWYFKEVRNALISGNVGTGKTALLTTMVGQLLAQTNDVTIADTKGANLGQLAGIDALKGQVFNDFEGSLKAINQFYDEMIAVKKSAVENFDNGLLLLLPESKSHFLVIDEINYFVEYGHNLSYGSGLYNLFNNTMSRLVQIALMGSGFGCYLIMSSSLPSAEYLPMILRNQLGLRINMGLPKPEVERMMFPDNQKEFQPVSDVISGWGFIQAGNDDVRSFFAPEIPKDFNLHEYMREQIAKREVV